MEVGSHFMTAIVNYLLGLWALALIVLVVGRWRQHLPNSSLNVLFAVLVAWAVARAAALGPSATLLLLPVVNSRLSFVPRVVAPVILLTFLLGRSVGGRATASRLLASAGPILGLGGLATPFLLWTHSTGWRTLSWVPFPAAGPIDPWAPFVASLALAASLFTLTLALNRLGRHRRGSIAILALFLSGWLHGLITASAGAFDSQAWMSRAAAELVGWSLAFLLLAPLGALSLHWLRRREGAMGWYGGADERDLSAEVPASDPAEGLAKERELIDEGTLHSLREELADPASEQELLQAAAELLAGSKAIDACWIGLVRPDGGGLRAVARAGQGWLDAPTLEESAMATVEVETEGLAGHSVEESRLRSWIRSHPQHEALLGGRPLSWRAYPLGHPRRWGVLVAYHRGETFPTDQEVGLVRATSDLASGYERWRSGREHARRIQLQERTLEAMIEMVSQSSLSDLLEVVVNWMLKLSTAQVAEVFMREADTESLRLAARRSRAGGDVTKGSSLRTARQAIEEERVIEAAPVAGRSNGDSWTMLTVPMTLDGRALGAINVGRAGSNPFGPEERDLLASFARQVAVVLDNVKRLEAERQRSAELETLRQASLNLTANLELESVLESILEQSLQVVSAFDAHIFLYDGERLSFGAALWASGDQREPFAQPREHGLTYTVARSGERIVVEDASQHPLFESAPWQWNGAILGMPLQVGQRVLGVMNVAFDRPHQFADEELNLLGLLADQAALVLENARLFDRTAAERRRLRLLYDNARALATTLDPDEVLQRAVELTTENLGGLIGTVNLVDHETGRMHMGAMTGIEGKEMAEVEVAIDQKVGKGLVGWVAETAQPALSNDVVGDDRWEPVPGVDDAVRSALAAPIFTAGQLMGVMAIFHHQAGVFQEEHSELLTAICQQISLAWSNANRYRQIERRLAEGTALQQVAQVINSRLEMEPLLNEIVEQVSGVLGYPVVDIVLVEDDELVLRAGVGAVNEDDVRLGIDEGVIGRVVRSGKPAMVPDVSLDPDYVGFDPPAACEIAVPLHKGDVVIGVLNVEAYEVGALDGEDLRLLTLLADQVSVAIENAALYDRLQRHTEELELVVGERTAELSQALAQAQEADRLKTQFVSDVSHELRTPLSNIQLYVELLERAKESRRSDYLNTLARETNRLVALIEDLLSISRLDADSMPMEFDALDLNELSEALVDDRRRLFSEQGISLRWLPSTEEVIVWADQQLLSQVVANLMTNAMHYTPRGGDVKVKTDTPASERWITLTVEDTGIGIPQEEQPQLFTRFFRGSASRQMGNPGTGLGLAICKEIIDRHGGRITVESDAGSGSSFTVWLPRAGSPDQRAS